MITEEKKGEKKSEKETEKDAPHPTPVHPQCNKDANPSTELAYPDTDNREERKITVLLEQFGKNSVDATEILRRIDRNISRRCRLRSHG